MPHPPGAPRILITMGDPAGVGPEVLLRSLLRPRPRVTVIGDRGWLERTARRLRLRVAWDRFRWIDLANVPPRLKAGAVSAPAGRAAFEYLEEAVRLLRRQEAEALVTAPVSKQAIVKAGVRWIGHTEFLAQRFRRDTVMMFVSGRLRIALATTHLPMRSVPGSLRAGPLARTLRVVAGALKTDYRIRSPRIAVAALNPHAGEGGVFGSEEKKVLLPAVRAAGAGVLGPLPSDSVMRSAIRGEYDAVVAMYHDQALIPIKIAGWERAVNVTLGLPFVRTSPVHGTAFDIAGRGRADHRSMLSAIELAARLA